MKGLKTRVIHYLEAEQHYRYRDYLRRDNSYPRGQFYKGLEILDPENDLEFEELLIKLAEHLKSAENTDPCIVTNRVLRIGVNRLFWCIKFFILRIADCYRNFAYQLMGNAGNWRVVSFNWDILVEQCLSEIDANWKYSLAPNDTKIPVIKPHGSINWSSFAQNSIVSKYRGWKPISADSKLSYDADHPLDNPDLDDTTPDWRYCLYPGDPDLPQSNADLTLLWQDVHLAIQSSERVVFIGYSLPEYDSYAGSAFRELCKNKAVEVYDPSSTTLERFHKAFPHAEREHLVFKDTPYALRSTRTA